MQVIKMDGTREQFKKQKLDESLKRSGTPKSVRQEIIAHILTQLHEGITTSEIYAQAYALLESKYGRPETSFRYSLRRAILEFGPSGFPFEKFVGELYRLHGYQITVGKKLKGKCTSHEMDVIGHKTDELLTAELKFHNKQTIKTDLKVALYVRARFDDLIAGGFYATKKPRLLIITNTKFSSNAIKYGECAGLELIGWNYPRHGGGNLQDIIESSGIHPLTCLSTLTKKQKQYFLDKGMVLCSELATNKGSVLHDARGVIPKAKISLIMEEIQIIRGCIGPTCTK